MSTPPYDPKFNDKAPFKSDGCSWFPDLHLSECCRSHDYAYWAGHDQLDADLDFQRCIADNSEFLGPFRFLFSGFIVTGMALGRPIRNLYLRLREKCARIKNMGYSVKQTIQQTTHAVVQHADEAVGYGFAGTAISSPAWVTTLTDIGQLLVVLIGIAVGLSTWKLNRIKTKALEKELEKD